MSTLATTVVAGPLFDPFVEKLQVGKWTSPESVELAAGFPSGLLEPARLDTAWTQAVAAVLHEKPAVSGQLSRQFLRHLKPAGQDTVWLYSARKALADFRAGRSGDPAEPFLRQERLTMAFSRAIEMGDPAQAAQLADVILTEANSLGLHAREQLVWYLRRLLARELAHEPLSANDELWPMLADLAPFDTNNAWTLWVAYRQGRGLSLLPQNGDQEELGAVLAKLNKGWFTAADLYQAGISPAWQSAVGAILLKKNELPAHFKKFPHPPANYSKQGKWVRGQRRKRQGQAGSYEQLAARQDLKPGWRMDVWRRASELRLLKGAWVEGLADLENALVYAKAGNGTKGQRRRLRQWTEQSMVLALAQNDLATVRRIRDLGLKYFQGDQFDAFTSEIRHWSEKLDSNGAPLVAKSDDKVDVARLRIELGEAADVVPVSETLTGQFVAAAERQLWQTWYKWGLELATPSRVTGTKRIRAQAYDAALRAGLAAEGQKALADSALAVIGLRFRDRPWQHKLLARMIDVEAGMICGWQTPPQPSLIPDLLPQVRGSELDRHALLGYCLATGDMRGILGLAYEIPARGLTRDEKRLFLYPLPAEGPIRAAIEAADNDPALLLAVARNESLFEPAVRSRAGALGWMQIMPFHYPERGAVFGAGNWRIPAMSIKRGDGLLTENRRRYHGDPYRILAAYNAGPGATNRWDKQLGGNASRDIYLAWIGYPETRAYVEKVLVDREIYHAIFEGKLTSSAPKH